MRPFSPCSSLRTRADRLGDEFLAEVLPLALRRRPSDPEVLSDLGHVLTRLGRYEEGLAVDRKLVELLPDEATVHYNLACSLALLGRQAEALDALERSVELGYDDERHLLEDEDLSCLRDEPRFQRLALRLRDEPRDETAGD